MKILCFLIAAPSLYHRRLDDIARFQSYPNRSRPRERESVGHPTMADFPPSFVQEVLMSRPGMREEMEIYTEALALADCGPRRRVRIPSFARRESPA